MIRVTTDGFGQQVAKSEASGLTYVHTIDGWVDVFAEDGQRIKQIFPFQVREKIPRSKTGFQRWVARQDR